MVYCRDSMGIDSRGMGTAETVWFIAGARSSMCMQLAGFPTAHTTASSGAPVTLLWVTVKWAVPSYRPLNSQFFFA